MIHRRIVQVATLSALVAAGLIAGLAFAPRALAWGPGTLPPGWSVDHIIDTGAQSCPSAYRIRTTTPGVFSDPLCEDSSTYQQDFDAWVNGHYTVTTTTAAAPTTTGSTDPVTTTDPAAPAPVTPTTTSSAPVTDPIAGLQEQIDALRAELQQLVCLLQTSQTLDPGILAGLLSLGSCG